jgi:digeranylgeranylglycerophospholipid reductase
MERIYQTIIIGAGPAGLMAGKYLENALILDKKQEIGKPIQCGEGISKKALEIQSIKPDSSWISCELHKMERIMPNGKAIGRFHEESIGYILDRIAFEKFLANQSKAEIQLNSKVLDLEYKDNLWIVRVENNQTFKAKYLIGADGFNSIVRQKVFPENQEKIEFIPAIEYLMEIEKEIDTKIAKFYLDNEKYNQGYAWIFPKSKNTANIGIGAKGNLKDAFDEFLEKIVKKECGNFKFLENISGVIPIRKDEINICKNNAILIGDAAGLADPIFKGGMNQAMRSAKIAAECILKEETNLYESKINLMPFVSPKLIEAKKILYSFNNQTLNELGELLEEKGTSYLKTPQGFIKLLSKPELRKNSFKLFKFLSIWQKNQDCLW